MNHPSVIHIDDHNKHLIQQPANANRTYFSRLYQAASNNSFRNISIKYVIEGLEHYRIGQEEYSLSAGQLLLANQQPDGSVYFDADEIAIGICIDIQPDTMYDALHSMNRLYRQDPEKLLEIRGETQLVFEHVYNIKQSSLRRKIQPLERALLNGQTPTLNEDWYFELAELIAVQECEHNRALRALDSVKASTRQEIYRRLLEGRSYMDECFLQNPLISEVAQHCYMSEFHFFRSFKQAFRITPHQYMLRKRLEMASRLIRFGDKNLSQVAAECGFPDLAAFSKTFKKHFQMAPSRYAAAL